MAYFYFDFRNVDKQKLHNLLPSLLIQLSARSDPCHGILSQLYSAHDHGEKQPSDCAMVECLKKMLILDAQGPTYIIVDALDECPKTSTIPPPREEVLDFWEGTRRAFGFQISHICVTSQPEPDIQAVLEPLTARPVSAYHDESGQQEDIADYVLPLLLALIVGHAEMAERGTGIAGLSSTLTEKADGNVRGIVVCLLVNPNLEQLLGFVGRSANWKSYWISLHEVSSIPTEELPDSSWTETYAERDTTKGD